eukprot:TRINITY_DN14105_c0_g1_i1.p4 TRINITY_DN14105_c0_g1~~TRINITY_DN14105_c0_g1_i1.p4  ORF type:complete len:232 (-),score=8.89 TRINITY_DN14105_c0_g1_i1:78-773(-)
MGSVPAARAGGRPGPRAGGALWAPRPPAPCRFKQRAATPARLPPADTRPTQCRCAGTRLGVPRVVHAAGPPAEGRSTRRGEGYSHRNLPPAPVAQKKKADKALRGRLPRPRPDQQRPPSAAAGQTPAPLPRRCGEAPRTRRAIGSQRASDAEGARARGLCRLGRDGGGTASAHKWQHPRIGAVEHRRRASAPLALPCVTAAAAAVDRRAPVAQTAGNARRQPAAPKTPWAA